MTPRLPSRFPHLLFCSVKQALGRFVPDLRKAHFSCCVLVLATALVALSIASGRLRAQEAPDPWPTDDPNEGAYSNQQGPAPQYGYGQPQGQQPQYTQPGPPVYADPNQPYPQVQLQRPPSGFSAEQIEQMVAPIALYPDNLVSIVLAASTYPAQVAAADQWLHVQGNAPPEQIAAGANAQSDWDPSVKALTAFPQVLDQLAQNLQWTTDLGNAYYNQPQDVMQTIQVMRSRAQSAGNLQNTPQQQVTVDQGYIELAPPDPQVVYVPTYDPWAVYGAPVPQYPGYAWVGAYSPYDGNFIQWGPGIAMQAFAYASFGWLGWGLNWFGHAVLYHHYDYCTHSYQVHDWGFAHGGPRAFRGWQQAGFRDGRGWGREDFLRAANNRGYNRGYSQSSGRFGNDRIAHGGYNYGNRSQQGGFGGGNNQHFGNGQVASGYRGPGNAYGYSGPQQGYGRNPYSRGSTTMSYMGRPDSGATRNNYGSIYSPRPGFGSGSGSYGRSLPGSGYSAPAYRSPAPGYGSAPGGKSHSFGSGSGFSYARPGNDHMSGGFHPFGSDRQSHSFIGGGRSFSGGGRSFRAPSAGHFSGGGSAHFGGGGHSSAGGHSSHHR